MESVTLHEKKHHYEMRVREDVEYRVEIDSDEPLPYEELASRADDARTAGTAEFVGVRDVHIWLQSARPGVLARP
jgi:hypothetical protein